MTAINAQSQTLPPEQPAVAPSYWLLDNRMTVLTSHRETEGRYDLIEGRSAAGTQAVPHRHRYAEQFYLLEGEMTIWAGSRRIVLRAGETFTVPAGTAHMAAVTGDGPAHRLVITSPSGFARLVEEAGIPVTGDAPPEVTEADLERLRRVAADIGDEILGPPGTPPEALLLTGSRSGQSA